MTKRFIVVVDAQIDFMSHDGALYVPGSKPTIPIIEDYLKSLKTEEVEGVLYTLDTHEVETYPSSKEAKDFPIHCVKGTDGWQLAIIPHILHNKYIPIYTLEKNVFNMWEQKDLEITVYSFPKAFHVKTTVDREEFFKTLETKEIEVIGVASDFCVKWAIEGFLDRGFNVTVRRDMVKGIYETIEEVSEKLSKPITII